MLVFLINYFISTKFLQFISDHFSEKIFTASFIISSILCILFIAIACGISIVACVKCNLNSLVALTDKQNSERFTAIKLCYIPAHFLVLIITAGFFNPFLLWASWVPLTWGITLQIFSGFTNIGACINLFRRKKCSLKMAIFLGVCSFVYILDFVALIIQTKKSKDS